MARRRSNNSANTSHLTTYGEIKEREKGIKSYGEIRDEEGKRRAQEFIQRQQQAEMEQYSRAFQQWMNEQRAIDQQVDVAARRLGTNTGSVKEILETRPVTEMTKAIYDRKKPYDISKLNQEEKKDEPIIKQSPVEAMRTLAQKEYVRGVKRDLASAGYEGFKKVAEEEDSGPYIMTVDEWKKHNRNRQNLQKQGRLDLGNDVRFVSDAGLEDWTKNQQATADKAAGTAEQIRKDFTESRPAYAMNSVMDLLDEKDGYKPNRPADYDRYQLDYDERLYDSVYGEGAYADRIDALETDEESAQLDDEVAKLWDELTPEQISQFDDGETLNKKTAADERRQEIIERANDFFGFDYDPEIWAMDASQEEQREALYDRLLDGKETYAERIATLTPEEKAELDKRLDDVLNAANNTYKDLWDTHAAEYQQNLRKGDAYAELAQQGQQESKRREDVKTFGEEAEELKQQGYTGKYNPELVPQDQWVADEEDPEGMINHVDQRSEVDKAYQIINGDAGLYNNQNVYGLTSKYSFLDDSPENNQVEQFNIFYEYDKQNGTHKAEAYLEGLDSYLNSCLTEYQDYYARTVAEQPVRGTIARVASYPMKVLTGIAGMAGAGAALLGNEAAKDPNSDFYAWDKFQNTLREQQNENIDKALGGNGTGKFFLGVVDSIADNLMAMGTGRALSPDNIDRSMRLVQAIMSGSATSSKMVEKLNQGSDPSEAALYAIGDGAIEWITEKYSLEQLLRPDVKAMLGNKKQLAGFIAKNIAAEGSEEIASDLLNIALDSVLSSFYGNDTEMMAQYKELISSGMSDTEASRTVLENKLGEIAQSGLAGGLSGGFMSGGRVALNSINQRSTGSNIKQNRNIDQLLELAAGMKENTQSRQMAEELLNKKNSKKNSSISSGQLGKLAQLMVMESNEQTQEVVRTTLERNISEDLKEAGVENPADYSEIITRSVMNGGQIGMADNMQLRKSKAAIEVWTNYQKITPQSMRAQLDISEKLPSRSIADQVSDMAADVKRATGVMADEINRSMKEAGNMAEAVDNFRQRRGDLMSEQYAQTVKELLETEKDAQKNRGYLEDALKIRLAAMTLNDTMPQTGLEAATAQKLYDAARAEFDALDEQRLVKQAQVVPGKGTATFDGAEYGTDAWTEKTAGLSKIQRNQMGALGEIAVRAGLNVNYINDTNRRGIYGFEQDSGAITINVAGLNSDKTQHHMLVTMAHEMTHWLEQNSKEGYKALRKFVLDSLRSKGQNVEDLIVRSIDNQYSVLKAQNMESESDLDVYGAVKELVARSCENILSSKAVEAELAKTNPSLHNKIKRFVKNFVARIREAVKGMTGSLSHEARILLNDTEKIAEIWLGARQEALEQTQGEVKTGEGRVSFSAAEEGEIVNRNGEVMAEELPGGTITMYSLKTWSEEDIDDLVSQLVKKGFDENDVDKWIKDVNSVAHMIALDRVRLDYEATPNGRMLKNNQEYIKTLDASTLCAKRLLYQGIFNEIQHMLPNTPLLPDDLINLVNMMKKGGLVTPCGICYVESRRRMLGKYAEEWLKGYDGAYKPRLEEVTTTDGLRQLEQAQEGTAKRQAYDDFVAAMNAKGSANPKVVQLRTDYKSGEIRGMTENQIKKVKEIGGLRVQSFSDFETPHLIDMMQAVLDMAAMDLTSQAYTKVPAFAWVFGDTGIKINLSLIGEGKGYEIDENGHYRLTFSNTEGMPIEEARALRKAYSKNVGTILVGMNDEHIVAAMGSDEIDFIIPFHKSGWSKRELSQVIGMSTYKDYTRYQNEKKIAYRKPNGQYKTIPNKTSKITNFQPVGPNHYWEFNHDGIWNAKKYLRMCKEDGRLPKFHNFLVDDGEGGFTLPTGTDERSKAIYKGYWKLLIDFKMYDNEGNPSEQTSVVPKFNMEKAYDVLNSYEGGANQLPTNHAIAQQFVDEYKKTHKKRSYSVAQMTEPQLDTEYMSAVKSGDTEQAQRLVDEAARRAGYTEKVYHGTERFGFTEFDMPGSNFMVFTAYNTDMAQTYAGEDVEVTQIGNERKASKPGIYQLYAKPGRQLVIDAESANWDNIPYDIKSMLAEERENIPEDDDYIPYEWEDELEDGEASTRAIAEYARDRGYDSVRINHVWDNGGVIAGADLAGFGDVGIFFNADDIKSADPVTYDDAGNVVPLSERFNPEKKDIRFSVMQSPDMEVDRFMMGLNEHHMDSVQERTMLEQYKGLHHSVENNLYFIREQEKARQKILDKEKKDGRLSTFDRNELTKINNRIETYQARLERAQQDLIKVTSEKGYARQMMKMESLVKNLYNGITADQLITLVETMTKQMDEVNREMQERAGKLNEMAQKEAVLRIRTQFNQNGLKRIASRLKAEMNSDLESKEIENRLALIALKMKEGKYDAETAEELTDLIIGKMRSSIDSYVLNTLRGRKIALSPAQLKELKARNSSLREINAELAGTGVRIVTSGGTNLEHIWGELSNEITSLEKDTAPLEQLDALMNVIRSERNTIFAERFNNESVQATTEAVLNAAAELVPEIVTDEKSLKLIKETLQFVREISGQAAETAGEISGMTAVIDRLKKTGAAARSKANELTGNINDALKYFNELSEQSEAALWKREKIRLIEQMKNEKTEALLDEQTKWKEKIEKDKAARDKMQSNMQLRQKINTNVNRIRKLLINETDQRNIPEHMKSLARTMLTKIVDNDMIGRKISGIDRKDLMETKRVLDIMNEQDGEFMLDDLRMINDEEAQSMVADALADIEDGIRAYNTKLEGKLLDNLQSLHDHLQKISDAVSTISSVINAERQISFLDRTLDVADAAEYVKQDLGKSRFKGERAGFGAKQRNAVNNAVFYGNMTPVYYFKMLRNKGMDMLWQDMQEGENRNGLETQKAKAYLQNLAEKTGYKNWENEKHEVTLGGQKMQLTIGNMMELYAIWKREQTTNPEMSQHLAKGGVYIQQEDENTGKPRRETKEQRAVRVTDDEINQMYGKMTDAQKEYIEGIVRYLSNDMSKLGNQASMRMYGIEKYKESYYFPMKVWDGVKSARSDKGITGTDENRMAHRSWSKRRTHMASNALVIGDFTADAVNHIVEMINYNTMAPAVENVNKVLNYQFEEGELIEDVTKRNLRIMFQQAYGKEALKYLEDFMKDINGGVTQDQRKTLRDKALTMFKKNAVAGSMSVVLQQPLSYIRASMIISPKYLTKAPISNWKNSYREMMEHSGVGVIKEMGRFDMNFGQSAKDWITPETKGSAYEWISDKATILPQLADRMTWTWIWSAVKAEQKAKHPGADVTSDRFLDIVGRRFNEVMRQTQVYDSILVKSSNMRSQNGFMKLITSFMAEPTLSLNVLADAVGKIRAGDKGATTHMAKAGATFLLSAVMQAFVKGAMGSGRTPDKKKTWWENFLNKYQYNLMNEANIASLVPGYSDLIEILKTGELKDDAMSAIGKLFSIVQTGQKWANGKGNGTWRDLEDTVFQFAQLFSNIPMKNISRDVRAMRNWIAGDVYADRKSSAAVIKYQAEANLYTADNLMGTLNTWLGDAGFKTSSKAYYSRMYEAEKKNDTKTLNEIREYMTLGKGVKEDSIAEGLRGLAKKDDKLPATTRIRIVTENSTPDGASTYIIQQMKAGKITDEQARNMIKDLKTGKDDNEIYWQVVRQKYQAETKAEKTPGGYYYRLEDAVNANKAEEITAAVKELLEHGIKKDQIKNKLSDWKRDYIAADAKGKIKIKDAITKAYKAAGYTVMDANKTIQAWSKDSKKTGGKNKNPKDTTGQWGRGNINLNKRKVVENADGTFSTEESFSINIDGKEVLLPTIINGKRVSEKEAIRHYEQTGEHLGKFNTVKEAEEYAEKLHKRQEWYYGQK